MKCHTIGVFLTGLMLISSVVYAGDGHPKEGTMGDGTTAHGMAHSSGMDMDAMNQRMQKMRDLMKKAHSTQDMQKRHELMREHMSEMRKMMKMTQGSGMMGKSGVSKNKPMQMGCDEKHGMMDHEMMANRLHMMEKMMGQMIDQQSLMLEK